MLGTAETGRGGIASVIRCWQAGKLDRRWPVTYLTTHCEGPLSRKLIVAVIAWARFITMLLKGEVCAVHAHTASRMSFWRKSLFLSIAFAGRIPWILHLHGAEFRRFWDDECGHLKRSWIRFVFRHADCVITLSPRIRTWIVNTIALSKTAILANPVMPMAFDDFYRNRTEILFLGRLGRRKGIFDLLAAVAELKKTFPNVRLWCCGDGDHAGVRRVVVASGLQDHVRITGWIGAADKNRLLGRAGIFALPSRDEGVPLSMLEAMSAGLPVVVGAVGGIPDVVTEGVEGFLVDPGDVTALTDRLHRLMRDADLGRRMGQAGRRKIQQQFALDAVMKALDAIYANLKIPSGNTT
jgi:glycosyltransferase involved in cell wall biosynthesis